MWRLSVKQTLFYSYFLNTPTGFSFLGPAQTPITQHREQCLPTAW